jgi:hypothetical protein
MARRLRPGRADAADEADSVHRLRIGQILDQIAPGLVDVGVDHMRRDRGRLEGELDPDVAADLTDPDRLALEADRAQPEPGMVARVNAAPGLLGADVLVAAEGVEWADRRVAVARALHERLHGAPQQPDHVVSVACQWRRIRAAKMSSARPTSTRLRGSPFSVPSSFVVQQGSCASARRSSSSFPVSISSSGPYSPAKSTRR